STTTGVNVGGVATVATLAGVGPGGGVGGLAGVTVGLAEPAHPSISTERTTEPRTPRNRRPRPTQPTPRTIVEMPPVSLRRLDHGGIEAGAPVRLGDGVVGVLGRPGAVDAARGEGDVGSGGHGERPLPASPDVLPRWIFEESRLRPGLA